MRIGVPVVSPPKTPERMCIVSASLRGVVILLCPGFRRSSSFCTSASVIAIPGGHPSTTTPTAPPCDSPKVVMRNNCPNEFPAIGVIITFIFLQHLFPAILPLFALPHVQAAHFPCLPFHRRPPHRAPPYLRAFSPSLLGAWSPWSPLGGPNRLPPFSPKESEALREGKCTDHFS